MRRTLIVSNRVADQSKAAQAGGVSVVMADILRTRPSLWFGWNGKIAEPSDDRPVKAKLVRAGMHGTIASVPLSAADYEGYYLGYSNSVLWPVFHNRLDLARFDAGFYPQYVEVNRRFAAALAPLIETDDLIWIHDYHLIPLAAELRKLGIINPIGFFLHIPVPPSQVFLAIPEHRELAQALAAYDLVGVQSQSDVANLIGFLQDGVFGSILQDGRIRVFGRPLAIESFPAGIDPQDFADAGPSPAFAQGGPNVQRIIGVDRLDYTKGLPEKFRAFGRFLEKFPAYRKKVVLSQIAPPTRESVEAYADIRTSLEALSGKINGLFGELDWVPIHYIHRLATRKRLRDIYRSSRICLVTPLRDGMNLVAKEYVAAQDADDPGVVILSRFAGAAEQLDGALIVNPYNIEEVADAIKDAIEMDRLQRQTRHSRLLEVVKRYDSVAWCHAFLSSLEQRAGPRIRQRSNVNIERALDKIGLAMPPGKPARSA